MRLTLLAPELIWPEPGDQLTLGKLATPGFEWLNARADFDRQPRQSHESALAGLFGLGHGGSDIPYGALRLAGESGTDLPAGHWLCADPVHLRFHHERIVLADAGAFDLDETEADALIASLNDTFADIGEFRRTTARRWYLRLKAPTAHAALPLSAMAGKRIDGELPEQPSDLARWLNEVQMFLHGHPVNQRREGTGQPAINSLWLWGNGELPAISVSADKAGFDAVYGDDPLARGLARAAGLNAQALPADLPALLAASGKAAAPLVVLDSLLPHVLYENGEGWRACWLAIETRWMAPLQQQLGRKIDSVRLVAPTIYGRLEWQADGSSRWKFWKKGRALEAVARALADASASPEKALMKGPAA